MTDEIYILISRWYEGHDHYYTEDSSGYDQEFHTIQGTWTIGIKECKGSKALREAIEQCCEAQADDPPYTNAYPVIAYDKKTKEVVWIPGRHLDLIWHAEEEYAPM